MTMGGVVKTFAGHDRLTYRLRDQTLIGSVGGKTIHSIVRGQPASQIAPGRYLVYPPVHHPTLGRVAAVVPLGAPALAEAFNTVGNTVGIQAVLTAAAAFTAARGLTLNPGASSITIGGFRPGSDAGITIAHTVGGVAAHAPRGFTLTDSSLTLNGSLTVSTGFRELMEGLAATGGATLEVIP